MINDWLNNKKAQLVGRYNDYYSMRPWHAAQTDINEWFASALGQRVLEEEKARIDSLLSEMFGYHLMAMSVLPEQDWLSHSPTSHQFSVIPVENELNNGKHVQAEFEHLPIVSNSIDVALLHHVLDFSLSPHQVLRETSRVLIPNGHIVLVGFNPWSLLGAKRPVSCLLSRSQFYRHHYLRVSRLKDWCKVLELEMVYCDKGYYGLPFNHYYSNRCEAVGKALYPFLGAFYVLVLRKNVTPMRMIKAPWKKRKVLPKWQKGVASSSASSSVKRVSKNNSETI